MAYTGRSPDTADTDWVANPDYPQTDFKTSMILYRQQLRDVTDQVIEGQPLNITWPQDPRIEETVNWIEDETSEARLKIMEVV